MSLSILRYMAMWEAKETGMIRVERRKKKFPWALQIPIKRCWARQFRIFGHGNTKMLHWGESWNGAWWMCLLKEKKKKKKKRNLPVSLSQSASPFQICQVSRYVQSSSFQNQLDCSSCSHVWWSVSRCQSCVSLQDMRYRNRRALSGRTESEGVEKETHKQRARARIYRMWTRDTLGLRCWDVKR